MRDKLKATEVPEKNLLVLEFGNQNWNLDLQKFKEVVNNPDQLKYELENLMR